VRDYEAISYQFTPTFFTSHKPSKTPETRMHYTMCYLLGFIHFHSFMFANLSVSVGLQALLQFLVERWLVRIANVPAIGSG
jgi:hypothetical protein